MLKPTSTAVMFVISTGRRRSTRMSTSGCCTLVSTHPRTPPARARRARAPARRGEPQPHALALLSPNSSAASATESSAAPSQSTFASGRVSSRGT